MSGGGSGTRVVVVGGGAMGCLFAAELAAGGAEVTVLDAAEQVVAALAADGVALVFVKGYHTAADLGFTPRVPLLGA